MTTVTSVADINRAVEAGIPEPVAPPANGAGESGAVVNNPAEEPYTPALMPMHAGSLPEQTAYIFVRDAGENRYQLELKPAKLGKRYGHEALIDFSKPRANPRLSMVDTGGSLSVVPREEFWQWIAMESDANRNLSLWLNALYHAPDAPYSIVIVDGVGLPFPWEMMSFEDENTSRLRPLGAAFAVTRWQQSEWLADTPFEQELPPEVRGKVIPYMSADINARESDILGRFTNQVFADIQAFKQRLMSHDAGYGLVYMGCHAILGDTTWRWMKLGDKNDVGQQITVYELGRVGSKAVKLGLISQSNAVVFLNACHSAIPRVSEPDALSGARTSFPERFLAKGAGGVIGTLGLVDDTAFAPEIVEKLIAKWNDGVSIAEALRQVRAVYDDALNEVLTREGRDPKRDELNAYFNAFMYVYYGSPLTKLKLQEGS